MEDLASNLSLAIHVRMQMEKGDSVRSALRSFAKSQKGDWAQRLSEILGQFERNESPNMKNLNQVTQGLIQLMHRGWKGESILEPLIQIEEEIYLENESQVDRFASELPIRLLVPLLLMQFPAFLLLIVGPLLSQFMSKI